VDTELHLIRLGDGKGILSVLSVVVQSDYVDADTLALLLINLPA
jgi:hypothetical protein